MFVLDEEAESPITQIIYSAQTQLLAGWLHSQLCLGGAIIKWFNLIESSDVGVSYADVTQVQPNNVSTNQHTYV